MAWVDVEMRNSSDKGAGIMRCGVTSFRCDAFLSDRNLRLVVQIIQYYNKRGASERNFECPNNDFEWAHLPFSFIIYLDSVAKIQFVMA